MLIPKMTHPPWSHRGCWPSADSLTSWVSLSRQSGGPCWAQGPLLRFPAAVSLPHPLAAAPKDTRRRQSLKVALLPRSPPPWSWLAPSRPPPWWDQGLRSSGLHSLCPLGVMPLGYTGGIYPSKPSTGPAYCQIPCRLPLTAAPRCGTRTKSMKSCWTTLTHLGPGLGSRGILTATCWLPLSCRIQV